MPFRARLHASCCAADTVVNRDGGSTANAVVNGDDGFHAIAASRFQVGAAGRPPLQQQIFLLQI